MPQSDVGKEAGSSSLAVAFQVTILHHMTFKEFWWLIGGVRKSYSWIIARLDVPVDVGELQSCSITGDYVSAADCGDPRSWS